MRGFAHLIQDHNRALPQYSSCQPDELSLPLTKVLAARFDFRVRSPCVGTADPLKDGVACIISMFIQWVKILPHGAGEKDGLLGKERL